MIRTFVLTVWEMHPCHIVKLADGLKPIRCSYSTLMQNVVSACEMQIKACKKSDVDGLAHITSVT